MKMISIFKMNFKNQEGKEINVKYRVIQNIIYAMPTDDVREELIALGYLSPKDILVPAVISTEIIKITDEPETLIIL